MARRRGRTVVSGITSGDETVLGQLARAYRLGPYGGTQAGEQPTGGRRRLQTPAEIIAAAQAAGLLPEAAAGERLTERYICIWTDTDTGEVIARIPTNIEYDQGDPNNLRYSRARSAANRIFRSDYAIAYILTDAASLPLRNLKVRCRIIRGSRFILPTSQE